MVTLDFVQAHPFAEQVWALGQGQIEGLNGAAARRGVPALAFGEPLPPMPFSKLSAQSHTVASAGGAFELARTELDT